MDLSTQHLESLIFLHFPTNVNKTSVMVIFRNALLICLLLATTVTLSWGKGADSEVDNGSGRTEETGLLSDDEDLDFKLDDGNVLTTSTDDDEDQEQEASGEEPTTSVFPDDDEQGEGSGDDEDNEDSVKTNIMNKKNNDNPSEAPDTPPVQESGNENSNSADNTGDDVVTEKPNDNISTSHFLAALIAGGAVGLLFALCVIMLLAYRIRKKDEGSYALDEQKKPASPNAYQYTQGQEYYA